jgi:hypothetical protein
MGWIHNNYQLLPNILPSAVASGAEGQRRRKRIQLQASHQVGLVRREVTMRSD